MPLHQTVTRPVDSTRRWWVLAIVIAAQFMFGVDAFALLAGLIDTPTPIALAFIMLIFGYGQGLVMAPLSGAVLSTAKPVAAGSALGMYGTIAQIGNAAGVAAIGAVFFAIESLQSARAGFLASLGRLRR